MKEFLEGLVVAIDLPNVTELDPNVSFCSIPDFDSLATLGVMTFCEIEYDKPIQGQWLWDNNITPQQLFDHVNS
jgi:hypothetical protein